MRSSSFSADWTVDREEEKIRGEKDQSSERNNVSLSRLLLNCQRVEEFPLSLSLSLSRDVDKAAEERMAFYRYPQKLQD